MQARLSGILLIFLLFGFHSIHGSTPPETLNSARIKNDTEPPGDVRIELPEKLTFPTSTRHHLRSRCHCDPTRKYCGKNIPSTCRNQNRPYDNETLYICRSGSRFIAGQVCPSGCTVGEFEDSCQTLPTSPPTDDTCRCIPGKRYCAENVPSACHSYLYGFSLRNKTLYTCAANGEQLDTVRDVVQVVRCRVGCSGASDSDNKCSVPSTTGLEHSSASCQCLIGGKFCGSNFSQSCKQQYLLNRDTLYECKLDENGVGIPVEIKRCITGCVLGPDSERDDRCYDPWSGKIPEWAGFILMSDDELAEEKAGNSASPGSRQARTMDKWKNKVGVITYRGHTTMSMFNCSGEPEICVPDPPIP